MKYLTIAIVLLLSPLVAAQGKNIGTVHLTHVSPSEDNAVWLRENQITPMYPMELARNGIAGCGVFKVIVDESSKTEEVTLVSSVPQEVIVKLASKVIESWDWKVAEGHTAKREEKTIRLDFCMVANSSDEEAKRQCVAQSKLVCEI
ncbi:energy transducer TonB [Idiomarina ramblicola]|uniref:Energy transducer TonB n=1 Tax=Idiomarina ramblicola TaxID=263724 RepID=A0A432YYQ4_9GAMM|nr:energy transducer TonB [Idiomarina ramblicola]RUO68753.1 energy transducer TonB [Idiomarina ramblicola]